MSECLFCKIVSGEIPSKKVYEDDNVYAFYDIDPQAPVHILFIPKQHIESAAHINQENSALTASIFEAISAVSSRLNLKDGFRVVTNCGPQAQQSVPHLHFHLLAGRDMTWPPG
ncbi:MAG: histidine triad nucleotide-binding protein [Clostridiales bacterium]|nr:histidine triad nucleotide-binding protein [Clostridiales bacterium]